MTTVRVASVGLGWWGNELAAAASRTGRLAVVSCFARTPGSRTDFATAHGCRSAESLEELLADAEVEALIVATTHDSHLSLIEAAADAGKHVFVEKPLTLSVRDGLAAVEAAETAGIVLQVGHQRRRTAASRAIRSFIDEGRLGDLQMLEANHSLPNGFSMPEQAWRWEPDQSPLGSMTSLGIHQIDTFMYLAGPISSVSAVSRPGRDVAIDEATGLLFEFESGAIGAVLSSFFTPRHIRLTVHGTDGAVFSHHDGDRLEVQARGEVEPKNVDLVEVDPVVDQLTEFAEAVAKGSAPEVGGRQALAVVAVLEAAAESVMSGRRVAVAEFSS